MHPKEIAGLPKYTVLELFSSGSRFVGDYSEEDAVGQYLELHPGTDRSAVVSALHRALAALPSSSPQRGPVDVDAAPGS